MSTLERLFFRQANDEDITQNYGVVPSDRVKRDVVSRLAKIGLHGPQGFDMATKTLSIMGGFADHLIFQKNDDDTLIDFQKPFDFPEPSDEGCSDHGLLDGYTYGLNILSRTLPLDIIGYAGPESLRANGLLRVVAKHRETEKWLIAKRVVTIPDSDIDFGYNEMPSNVNAISGYLVLDRLEALEKIQKSVFDNLR